VGPALREAQPLVERPPVEPLLSARALLGAMPLQPLLLVAVVRVVALVAQLAAVVAKTCLPHPVLVVLTRVELALQVGLALQVEWALPGVLVQPFGVLPAPSLPGSMRHPLKCQAMRCPVQAALLAPAECCDPKTLAPTAVVPAALVDLWQEWWPQWEKQVRPGRQPAAQLVQPWEGQHLVGKLVAATLQPEPLVVLQEVERHPAGACLPN